MEQVRVSVCALDPITQAGVSACLEAKPDLVVVPHQRRSGADVVVAAFERLSTSSLRALSTAATEIGKPTVLLIDDLREGDLPAVMERRVVAILPRTAVVDSRVTDSIRSASVGGATLSPNLLGQLVQHTERLYREVIEPSGLSEAGLAPREVEVLRLMADGLDTGEIARNLSYSERTVKNIFYSITTRLRLRNRPHAVAFAMRTGVI